MVGDWVVSCGQSLKCIKGSRGKFRGQIYKMPRKAREIPTADMSLKSFWGRVIANFCRSQSGMCSTQNLM